MDPYYQQQSQQGQQPVGPVPQQQVHHQQHQQAQHHHHQQSQARADSSHLMGGPSAPMMQQQGLSSQQQQQQQMMMSNQQQQVPSAPQHQSHRSSYGSGQQQASYQQQQQDPYQPPGPGHQRSSNGAHHLSGGSSMHHHGGQPPLPPGTSAHASSGHHSSSRNQYGGRDHRSAMLHQHRSSAAAISDPMMASTITDQLASASGPITGSGSALNQLAGSGGGYYGGPPSGAYYGGRLDGDFSTAVYPPGVGPGSHHQSRYEAHYLRNQHRLQQQQLSSGGATTTGAYHLGDMGTELGPTGQRYYGAGGQLHQSLGNLPSRVDQQLRYSEQHMPADRYLADRYALDTRAGSMPPTLGHSDGLGLGAYNPLDDPLQQQPSQHLHQVGFGQQAGGQSRDLYVTELRARLQELQNSYAAVKRELEAATQKLGSSMHSIKSFWSPELKKERALRKEEATKYALINDQMKLMRVEVQKQASLIQKLEEELRFAQETRVRAADLDVQQHIDALCMEKEALFKDNCLLRETIRELEMRLETQKQTLAARDESIKKMVEMMNNKGIATKMMEDERLEADRIKMRNIELEARLRHYETIIEAKEKDIIKLGDSQASDQKPTRIQTSKAERLKNRLAASCATPRSSKDISAPLDSSGLSNSASTSSGFSSSTSRASEPPVSTSEPPPRPAKRMGQVAPSNRCQCRDCLSYSWPPRPQEPNWSARLANQRRAPTPPKLAPRKAVSFRSSVEHINSPGCHKLSPMATVDQQQERAESCDSMHVTKDYSLYLEQTPGPSDQPLARPLDSSTPKQVDQQASEGQLIEVEVHRPPTAVEQSTQLQLPPGTTDYTCLCSADFNCVHNNYPQQLALQRVANQQLLGLTPAGLIDNELYGATSSRDFLLESNCIECRNLSTYVNLSDPPESRRQSSQAGGQLYAPSTRPEMLNLTGYGSNEYKSRLLRSSKSMGDVYANWDQQQLQYQLNEQARRLEQTLDNCAICHEQIRMRTSNEQQCICPAPADKRINSAQDDQSGTTTTKSSYHTASSSLVDHHQSGMSSASARALMNASQLSVLPVTAIANEQEVKGLDAQMDSSLSSLFVYRHRSDDNQDEFDPDSLEIQANNNRRQMQSTSTANKLYSLDKGLTSSSGKSWLQARPRSDYISLSSTVSSLSSASKANNPATGAKSGATKSTLSQSTGKQKVLASNTNGKMQVDADLTQSSLAKRRQLNKQQQQLQQQQTDQKQSSNKKKLLASKVNSRSSPNVSSSSKAATESRSNVKNIYQCVKNHLLVGKKSTGSSTVNLTSVNNSVSTSLAASSSKSGSRADISNLSPPNNKSARANKATQMEELRNELVKRDQELLTMNAKMKALEDQQRDSQRHIRVLKDSLVAKEEHYNLLLAESEELRRNLDERNKKTYQQMGGRLAGGKLSSYQELEEMQAMMDLRDKKINDLQRRVMQFEGLLQERESQLDRARMRCEHVGQSSNNPDYGLLNHLEEALGDKEKQISLLRDQRDRAEHELNEERDSHERSIKEYKMKLNSVKFELEKLQNRLNKESKYTDFSSSSASADQSSLIKRLELDKRSLQLECDRLKDRLENTRGSRTGGLGSIERASSALGGDYSVVEFERLQESLEVQKQELRRAQAESRMNEMERKRAQEEADKLSERFERLQSESLKLKAKLENAISEREQLLDELNRQQQMIGKAQSERDSALADSNQLKLDNERMQQSFNKNQLQVEKLQAQLERAQVEQHRLEEQLTESSQELHRLQTERSSCQRELKSLEMQLRDVEMQRQHLQQEKEATRLDLAKIRDKYERLEAETERWLHDKELNSQQASIYKERLEAQQQQVAKAAKEKEQMSLEIHELRERLHKQQKLQDTSEHETRNEVRIWKEKYERLMGQYEKLNEDQLARQKEMQMVMEKLQRVQSEMVKMEAKLEQSEMDRERLMIEVEKSQQVSQKVKEEHKRWQDETEQLQEMYTKTNSKLLKLSEVEEKLRIDYDKCQMDLEVLRDRYEKLQNESRKLQSERDRLQVEHERIRYDNERIQQSQGSQQATQDDFIRLKSELERCGAKLEQYQREINKLNLEKERLLLDSKAAMQQIEQQFQQQQLKSKSNEEKLVMELERARMQLEKSQARQGQMNADQEKLVQDKERIQQQLLLLQQEVDKFRNQQSSSVQETKKLHDEEIQRVLQELETVRDKYTQQRKDLLHLRELQQNHDIDKEILKRELESAEARLEKVSQTDSKQKQDSERSAIEIEKLRDKIERKQQELIRTQKERDQFAQEVTLLHQQLQQLHLQCEQQQQQSAKNAKPTQGQAPAPQQAAPADAQGQAQQAAGQVKPEEVNRLKQMLVKSENDLQKTRAENQRLQMEIESFKLQLDDAAEYIGKIENETQLMQKQNQEIIQQLQRQLQQVQSRQQSGGQQQQQQQQNLQQELERAQAEMKKMQDVIKKSANEIQKMVDERNKLQDINKEIQRDLEQTRVKYNANIEQYEAELQRLQQQPQQSSNKPQAANEEYKVKFEKAVEAIKAFQKTSDDMKKEIIKLNERNKSLADQNQNLVQTLKATEESLRQQQSNKNNDKSQAPDEAVKQQVGRLTEMCSKLQSELARSAEETQRSQQASQQMKQALEKSQAELASLKTERDRFQSQLEKLMVELERREDEMTNLQAQKDKSGQNVQGKQNELAAFQKQLEEREKALEAKREELHKLAQQQQQQQQQLNQQQQQLQQNKQQAGNQTQQQETVVKLQQQIKSLEEERNKLRAELDRVRNELKQSQMELERLLKIMSASEEEKFVLKQQIEQLQAKLKPAPTNQQQQQARIAQQPPLQAGPNQQQAQKHPQQPPQPQQQQQQQQQQQPQPQQAPKPVNQGQPEYAELNSNYSIRDNMELLELALKQSIGWSMRNRPTGTDDPKTLEGIEVIKSQTRDESHIRAFVTHFKIELNNLMGLKRLDKNSVAHRVDDCEEDCEDDSLSDGASVDSDSDKFLPNVRATRGLPNIKIDAWSSRSERLKRDCKIANRNEVDDVDDGYRSLSRNSFRTSLLHQLVEIKSLFADLVQEIEMICSNNICRTKMVDFENRKFAFAAKLNSIIEDCVRRTQGNSPPDTCPSSPATTTRAAPYLEFSGQPSQYDFKNKSAIDLKTSNEYEEQVQVINYDFRRRASDHSGIKAELCRSSVAAFPVPPEKQPIDFGAMIRNFEERNTGKSTEGLSSTTTTRDRPHAPSNSTTSNSSSSSSSFL